MPVLEADVFSENVAGQNTLMTRPFGLMFEALDDLKPGEIYVCSGASPRYALWGGLMTTRAMQLGAAGAVVDGFDEDPDKAIEHLKISVNSFFLAFATSKHILIHLRWEILKQNSLN